MLDQLVESKSNSQNTKRRGGYLVTTGVLVFSMFASGILWSLFAKDLNIGGDNLELSSIVAPVPVNEDVPTEPEPIKEVKQDNSPKSEDNTYVRKDNIANTSEPIAPKDVSTSKTNLVSRPNTNFKIGTEDYNPSGGSTGASRERTGNDSGPGVVSKSRAVVDPEEDKDPPPSMKKVEPKIEKPKVPPTISRGVINGTAISLPKPPYPAPAKAVRAGGDVSIQVTIDERGNVISASAVSGHPLLRKAAEDAARGAKFKPTLLSEVPVKVTGIIIYKFTPQ